MSDQEDPILTQISLLIAHIQAQSDATSQRHIRNAAIDVSLILYTLSLLYASYQASKSSSTRPSPPKVPFRFLALPPELRFMIYDYLLVSPFPDHRIKCVNGYLPATGFGLSPQILRVNSEIYAEAVGVLYEKNVFQLCFSEVPTPGVWGLENWQEKLFGGMRGVGKGEDADSADLNKVIEAPDPEMVRAGPVAPVRLSQRLTQFMQNLLRRVRLLQHHGIPGCNTELLRFRPTKIHPHRLRRMRHIEIISSFHGTLSANSILAEDVQLTPSGENAFTNELVIIVLKYLIATPPPSEDMLLPDSNNSIKTLLLIHRPNNWVWPSPRLTVADKRRLYLQVWDKFELLHALTYTRRVSVSHIYWLVGSLEAKVDEFEEENIPNLVGTNKTSRDWLESREQMTARVCGVVGGVMYCTYT